MKSKILTIICAAGSLLPLSSQAASVLWDTSWTAVTNNTAILTLANHNYVGFNLNGSDTTINNGPGGIGGTNVLFTAVPLNSSGTQSGLTLATSGFDFQSTGGGNSNVVSAVGSPQTFATVLDRVIGDDNGGGAFNLSGLTVGFDYYVQFFSSAPDSNILSGQTLTSGGVASTNFGAHSGGDTRSIYATFTADSTSQSFTLTGTSPEDTYSAVVVGSIPEPSTALLGGMGLASLLLRRRRN